MGGYTISLSRRLHCSRRLSFQPVLCPLLHIAAILDAVVVHAVRRVHKRYRAVQIPFLESQEAGHRPAVSVAGQRYAKVGLVLDFVPFGKAGLDEGAVDALLKVQEVRRLFQPFRCHPPLPFAEAGIGPLNGRPIRLPKEAALHVQTIDLQRHPSRIGFRQLLDAGKEELKVLFHDAQHTLLLLQRCLLLAEALNALPDIVGELAVDFHLGPFFLLHIVEAGADGVRLQTVADV